MKYSDSDFMKMAIEKAQAGIGLGQTPFGACIVKQGQVISCCHNEVWKTTDITAHAEMVAIRRACKKLDTIDLSGCIIYSTCEPCPMCFSAIHWARVSRIVYGAGIADANRAGFNELKISNKALKAYGHSHVKIQKGLLRSQALELFDQWQKLGKSAVY